MFDDPTDPAGTPGQTDDNPLEAMQGMMEQLNDLDGVHTTALGIDPEDLPFDPDDPEEIQQWLTERVTIEITAPRYTQGLFASRYGSLLHEHGDLDEADWNTLQFTHDWIDSVDGEATSVGMTIVGEKPDGFDSFDYDVSVSAAEPDPRNDDAELSVDTDGE